MHDETCVADNQTLVVAPEPAAEINTPVGSKAESIREYFDNRGWNTPNQEVFDALKDLGIKKQQIYNIQAEHRKSSKKSSAQTDKKAATKKTTQQPACTDPSLSSDEFVTLIRLLGKASTDKRLKKYCIAFLENPI